MLACLSSAGDHSGETAAISVLTYAHIAASGTGAFLISPAITAVLLLTAERGASEQLRVGAKTGKSAGSF